jgi:hypothetical protein
MAVDAAVYGVVQRQPVPMALDAQCMQREGLKKMINIQTKRTKHGQKNMSI